MLHKMTNTSLNFDPVQKYSQVSTVENVNPKKYIRKQSQQEIEANCIKKNILCIKDAIEMPNDEVEAINNYMIPVGIITGLLMFVKGLLTGGLSIFGLALQFFYFSVLSYAAIADQRGDWVSRFIPSISGLFLCVSQIIGIFIINGPFECDDFRSCL